MTPETETITALKARAKAREARLRYLDGCPFRVGTEEADANLIRDLLATCEALVQERALMQYEAETRWAENVALQIMESRAIKAEADLTALRGYVQHKPECDVLTPNAIEVTCPHCNGTGRATDPKHQMKDGSGTAWPENNCAPCAGTRHHTVLKYPSCTCGLDHLLRGSIDSPMTPKS